MMARRNKLLAACAASFLFAAPAAFAQTSGDATCPSAVLSAMDSARAQAIANQQTLAANNYQPMTQSFGSLSCLDNILNSGVDIFFQVPSLSQILSMLQNAICQAAQSAFNQAIQPITSKMGQASSMMSGNTGSALNGLVPGVNLGSIGGGVQLMQTNGGSNGPVQTNLTSVLNGNGSYGGQTGVFGGGSTGGSGSGANSLMNGLFGSNSSGGGMGQNIQWNQQ
jgi:hypothetical protein